MRWPFVLGIALLAGFMGTGCPETYGKRGTLDDAMAEDMEEQRDERKRELGEPVPCTKPRELTRVCDDENQRTTCHWECK
ncbi:hypothetical protein [Archangium violaceum]|uniref:Lipoprotein n=1 Tax=Archangium violaceum Cb vi76 TaxID=1406225 RepID=A0A084SN14_9BACT|nr:hypothetical protein [Archangium violaceum]KFA89849.1 hypothetical protein Q664_32440 [Archangium violaceum Cb vi76]